MTESWVKPEYEATSVLEYWSTIKRICFQPNVYQLVHPAIQVIRLNNFLSLPFPQIWKSGHKGQDGKQSLPKPVDHSQVGSETISSKLFRLPKNVKWDYTSPVETFANKVLKIFLGINVLIMSRSKNQSDFKMAKMNSDTKEASVLFCLLDYCNTSYHELWKSWRLS